MARENRVPNYHREILTHQGLTPLSNGIAKAIPWGIFALGILDYEKFHVSPIMAVIPAGFIAYLSSSYITQAFQSDEGLRNTSGSFLSQFPTTREKVFASIGYALFPTLIGTAAGGMVHEGLSVFPFINETTNNALSLTTFLLMPAAATRRNIVTRDL